MHGMQEEYFKSASEEGRYSCDHMVYRANLMRSVFHPSVFVGLQGYGVGVREVPDGEVEGACELLLIVL